MINLEAKRPINIAGPCAAESRKQIIECASMLQKAGIGIMRTNPYKPRTAPGFEGVGKKAIPWMVEVARMELTPAFEVLLAEDVTTICHGLNQQGINTPIIAWIGARNQNHRAQKQIARRVQDEAPAGSILMIKNQMWSDMGHWLGIVDHVLNTGFPERQILLCHRGFHPNGANNPYEYRNLPDYPMAMEIKQKTGRPMILDPSHIGGSVENVFRVVDESLEYPFDGLMVEVHPNPQTALTDAKQQLTISQLKELLIIVSEMKQKNG